MRNGGADAAGPKGRYRIELWGRKGRVMMGSGRRKGRAVPRWLLRGGPRKGCPERWTDRHPPRHAAVRWRKEGGAARRASKEGQQET